MVSLVSKPETSPPRFPVLLNSTTLKASGSIVMLPSSAPLSITTAPPLIVADTRSPPEPTNSCPVLSTRARSCTAPDPVTISSPPLRIVPLAVPPTSCSPPLNTVVFLALPRLFTEALPPLLTTALTATPVPTTSSPPLSTVVLVAIGVPEPPSACSPPLDTTVPNATPLRVTPCPPPLETTVAVAVPPDKSSRPPRRMLPLAAPPEKIVSRPPLDTVKLLAAPPLLTCNMPPLRMIALTAEP